MQAAVASGTKRKYDGDATPGKDKQLICEKKVQQKANENVMSHFLERLCLINDYEDLQKEHKTTTGGLSPLTVHERIIAADQRSSTKMNTSLYTFLLKNLMILVNDDYGTDEDHDDDDSVKEKKHSQDYEAQATFDIMMTGIDMYCSHWTPHLNKVFEQVLSSNPILVPNLVRRWKNGLHQIFMNLERLPCCENENIITHLFRARPDVFIGFMLHESLCTIIITPELLLEFLNWVIVQNKDKKLEDNLHAQCLLEIFKFAPDDGASVQLSLADERYYAIGNTNLYEPNKLSFVPHRSFGLQTYDCLLGTLRTMARAFNPNSLSSGEIDDDVSILDHYAR